MNGPGRPRVALLALVLLLAWPCAGLRAEVAVADISGGTPVLYSLSRIVDDPDPINGIWLRFNGDGRGRYVLNEQGYANLDGRPSLLLHPGTARPLVAWPKNSPGGYDIVISSFADGAWTDPLPLATEPLDELDPVLALDPDDGTVHLVYWVADAPPRVMHRQAPADLSSWSAPEQVSPAGSPSLRPSAIVRAGEVEVVFEEHPFGAGTTPRQIVLATRGAGGIFTNEVLATTSWDGEHWPQIHHAAGQLWVDWIDASGEMTWSRKETGGAWGPLETEPFTSVEEREYEVRGTIRSLATESP
jgi:hypothetical protein